LLDEAGLRHAQAFAGLDEAGRWDGSLLESHLDRLSSAGVTSVEFGCHPGPIDDPDRSRFRWGYEWGHETAALVELARGQRAERSGFRLGDHRELSN
jgi:hypothetical protein